MKRPPPNSDAESASVGSKKRRRMSISDEDDALRVSTFSETPPMHKIYNNACRKEEKPDELFRKDLISAMKLPDNEQLDDSEFWDVSDSWKQEWERGVQVPVNSKNVPNPEVRIIREKLKSSPFKLPKKLIRTTEDSFFSNEYHVLSDVGKKAENICKYDLDDLDSVWIAIFNERREDFGLSPIVEETFELILEDFETQCSNRFQDALKTEKGLGIEYDEDVICDVCRSPECEEGNEMVFCDSCNICVHQACYGITAIPEGSWVCRPCALNIKPPCILCPNMGGAMKSTSSGEKWAHVSCALWIPEVSIGCPEKMEPIMRISHIPASRWALICSLCRERVGACIQCSVKQCKVAYHVTCAFEHGLEMEMKTTPIDSNEEGVKMQSYCAKHSKTDASERNAILTKSPRKSKKKKEVKTEKEPECKDEVDEHNARLQKIRSLEAQFHRFVNIKDTAELYSVDIDVVEYLYYYWVLKRRAKFNKPLLIAKCEEANLLIKQHENLLYSRLKMFVHLRQDLERVRNLCYMVSRREKMFRSYIRIKSQIFEKQAEIMTDESLKLTPDETQEILKARVGDSLFDKFYCAVFEEVKKEEQDDKNSILNQKLPNPYAKNYSNKINTRSRRRTVSQGTFEDSNQGCDTESNEMPVLTKCKSEEYLSSDEKQNVSNEKQKILTCSPFVVKLAPQLEENQDVKPFVDVTPQTISISDIKQEPSQDIKIPANEDNSVLEAINAVSESNNNDNIQKGISNTNEVSNDKNSLCLSDKENINGLVPVKNRKTRSQSDSRHTEFKNVARDFSAQKPDLFDDDSCLSINSEISVIEGKKIPRRSTRYQMRNRQFSTDIIEIDDSSIKSVDSTEVQSISSPSNDAGDITFLSQDKNILEEKSLDLHQNSTPRRRRGRPRKIVHCDNDSVGDYAVIQTENNVDDNKLNSYAIDKANTCVMEVNKISPCSEMMDLSDSNESTGFKMSLRHNRECLNNKTLDKKPKRKRSVTKLETNDLKSPNRRTFIDNLRDENNQNSPTWNDGEKSPSSNSPDKPASTRIIIRLRKDPNRESWKNDSSSSSDGNVAFRIVHNDLDVNGEDSISNFPSIIKDDDSVPCETYHNESRHRYLMRDRPVLRTAKCNLGRS